MPNIKSSTDLRNNYNDLFNKIMGKYELYQLLEQSESDFTNGRTLTFDDSMKSLREGLKNGTL